MVAVAHKGTDIHKWKSAATSESPPPDMGQTQLAAGVGPAAEDNTITYTQFHM